MQDHEQRESRLERNQRGIQKSRRHPLLIARQGNRRHHQRGSQIKRRDVHVLRIDENHDQHTQHRCPDISRHRTGQRQTKPESENRIGRIQPAQRKQRRHERIEKRLSAQRLRSHRT